MLRPSPRPLLARAATVRSTFVALPEWRIGSLGAYFAYLRHPFRGLSAWQVVEDLATLHGVMLLPAPAFAGSPDHLRVSFANVDSLGIERLVERLAGVSRPVVAT